MTDELTPDKVARGIHTEIKRIRQLITDLAEAGDDLARAEVDYKSSYARARLGIRGLSEEKLTVGEVDDRATDQCADQHITYLLAQSRHTTVKESIRASQSRLDAMRSLLSSFRSVT